MKKLSILLTALFFLTAFNLYAAEVKNTVSRQVGNRIQFTYDLIGDEADAEVDVTLTIQGKSYKASDLHMEGTFGKVRTGKRPYPLLERPAGLSARPELGNRLGDHGRGPVLHRCDHGDGIRLREGRLLRDGGCLRGRQSG